jgi:hypothetical protein
MRRDPRVSITVLGADDWYHHLTRHGRVVAIEDDPEFEAIDRLSRRYMGQPYPQRDRARVSAWIEVESWHAWAVIEAWTGAG